MAKNSSLPLVVPNFLEIAECAWVATSAAAQLSGHEPNEREAKPLSEAKGTKQLLLGVFEGEGNGIDG